MLHSDSAGQSEQTEGTAGPGREHGSDAPRGGWGAELRQGVRRPEDLHRLPLAAEALVRDAAAARAFKLRVPASYLALIDWDDPADPIRRQALPSHEELAFDPRERTDPIGDRAHSPVPHLTHRYPDRVLLYPTYICSMYCRHCFRKESLAEGKGVALGELGPALEYIAAHEEIREVILTGGDPLMLSDAQLGGLRERLERIEHLRLLRVHTRVPVTLPTRVTADLVDALRGRLMTAVVTHFNHPREITPDAAVACRRLREAGLMLLNQAVLLRGVNDEPAVMEALCRELVYTLGAKPYYLHHCDLTRGLTHFRTTIDQGQALVRGLRGRVSGLCIPQYVLDLPGGDGKIPIGPEYVRGREGGRWTLETYDGRRRAYEEVVASDVDRGEASAAAAAPASEARRALSLAGEAARLGARALLGRLPGARRLRDLIGASRRRDAPTATPRAAPPTAHRPVADAAEPEPGAPG